MALTNREEILVLSIFEAEAENARLIEQKWENTPEEGYEDGPEALAYEQAFARGVAHSAGVALATFRRIIETK